MSVRGKSWGFLRALKRGLGPVGAALREPAYRALSLLAVRGVQQGTASGCAIRIHPRFLGWSVPNYEPELMAWFRSHLHAGDVVFDVGAHVGLYTLVSSQLVGETGRVAAFEAAPPTFALLEKHLRWNRCRNVQAVNAAAGESEGDVSFTFRASPTDPGACANSRAYAIEGGTTATIPMTTLDSFAEKSGLRPRFIKIDVEGAEGQVLRGAVELLRAARPTVVCSFHPDPIRSLGETPSGIVAWMEKLGYRSTNLEGGPISDPTFQDVFFLPL